MTVTSLTLITPHTVTFRPREWVGGVQTPCVELHVVDHHTVVMAPEIAVELIKRLTEALARACSPNGQIGSKDVALNKFRQTADEVSGPTSEEAAMLKRQLDEGPAEARITAEMALRVAIRNLPGAVGDREKANLFELLGKVVDCG